MNFFEKHALFLYMTFLTKLKLLVISLFETNNEELIKTNRKTRHSSEGFLETHKSNFLDFFSGIFQPNSKTRNVIGRFSVTAMSVTAISSILLWQFSGVVHAQQREIVNQNFIELKNSSGTLLGSFNSQYPNMICIPGGVVTTPLTGTGNCLRYVNDSRCEAPVELPADTDICVVGWETRAPEVFASIVSAGYIAHPIQLGVSNGGLLEDVSVPNGSAELNADAPNRLYQNVCLAANETIPFSFDLADPGSTGTEDSQVRIGIWSLNSEFPATSLDSFTSTAVGTPTFQTFTGSLTAPATSGIYQIGFESVAPAAGTQGNYLQAVSVTLPPLVDIGGAGSLTGNQTYNEPGGTTQVSMLSLRLNGIVGAGVTIPINLVAGSTATPDADFILGNPTGPVGTPSLTHLNGTSTWVINVPAGSYSGGTSQANIEVPISILSDAITETPETLSFSVGTPSGATLSDPICASDFVSTSGIITIFDPNPSQSIVKVLDSNADEDGSTNVTLNDTLSYSITLTNNGNVTLNNVVVSDPLITPNSNTCTSVAPAATCVLTGTYVVTQADVDAGQVNNVGSGTSTEVPGPTVTPTLTTPVTQNPSQSIVKVLDSNADEDGSTNVTLNDTLSYSITLTNNGTVTLNNVVVSDALITPNSTTCATLAPAATCVLTGTYVVTQADVDAGQVNNVGSGTSTEVPGPTVTPTLTTPVTQNPSQSIVKVLDSNADEDGSTNVTLNDTLSYSITLTNNGTVTLNNVVVSDPLITPNSNTCTSVAPAATCVLTGTYVVTQADVDAGQVNNVGSGTSTEVPGPTVTPTLTTPVTQNPSQSIVKVLDSNADEDGSTNVTLNDTLSYSITLTNNGTVTLNNVVVSDPLITPNSTACATLAPAATCVLTGTYVVTQADVDAGQVNNVGSGTSTEVPGPTVTPTLTTPVTQNPSQSIVKVLDSNADEDGSTNVTLNDTLSYSITLTNNGTVTLNNVVVSDPLITPNSNTCTSVAPAATCVLTGTYVVTQVDVDAGQVNNVGSGTSTEVPGPTVTPTLTTPVTQNPSQSIVKVLDSNADEDGSTNVTLNDTLSYSITLTNNGTVTLNNVVVSDPLITPNSTACATLAPAATCVLTGTYVVTQADVDAGQVNNVGSGTSTEVPGPTVTPTLTTPVTQNPSQSIVKVLDSNADEDGSTNVTLNDTLSYSITLTNNGTVTLNNVVVSDPLITPNSNTCTSVAPAATCVLTGTYVVTQVDVDAGQVNNVGSGTSTEVPGPTVTPTLTTPVTQNPSQSIVKVLDSNADEDGSTNVTLNDTLSYSITLTNNGTVTLNNVVVSDPLITPNSTACATLAPAATCVLTGTYVVTRVDVDAGRVNNVGSGTSTEVPGPTVTPTLTTPVTQNLSQSIVKVLDSNADEDGSTDVTLNDTLSYSITLTNNGTVTLNNVVVSDPLITPNSTACATLAPAATCVLTGTYVVTQADVDAGQVNNVGSGTSTEVPGPTVTPTLTTPVTQNPSQSIVKVLDSNADEDGSTNVTLNDTLSYSITLTNNGTVTLNNVVVSDALITPNSTTCASVAPAATCVLTGTYVVTQADVDAGQVNNVGSGTSTEVPGPTVTPTLTTPVTQNLSQSIVKVLNSNADEDSSTDVTLNDTLSYSITLTNNGTVTLNNVVVSDPLITPNSTACATLAPAATCVLTGTYVVTQADVDAGQVNNVGSGTSTEVPGPTVTPTLTTPVTQNPSQSIVKVLDSNADEDGSTNVTLNDTLSYSITLTNNGTVTLNNVVVSDALITPNSTTCASVAPAATCVLTGTYVVTQADVDAGQVNNVGSGTSTEVPGPTVTPTLTTPVTQNPSQSIVKVLNSNADEDSSTDVTLNDTLSYSITLTNNGNVTLNNVVVSDALITPNSNTCTSVAPAATCVLTGTYVVTRVDVDAGQVNNVGSGTSTEVPGPTVTPTLTTPVTQNLSQSIVKVLNSNADEDSSTDVTLNDTLSYSITLTNNGTVTLNNVVVSDPLITPNSNTCTSVAPAATCVLTGTYVVTQADVDAGQVNNVGSGTSTEVPGPTVTPTLTTPVTQNPSQSIVKVLDSNADEDGSTNVTLNDTLSYSITLTNNGTVTLNNVVVSDPLITPNSTTCASVAPAATCVLTGTYVVTQADVDAGQVNNVGSGTSTEVPGPTVTPTLTTPVTQNPSQSIVKVLDSNADEDGNAEVSVGDTLSYTLTATNDGTVTLTDVVVSDPLITPNSTTCASVAPAATCVLTGSYVVQASDVTAGQIVNTGTADSDQTAAVTDSETTSILASSLSVVKAAPTNADEDGNTEVSIGDTLSYSITATNDGAATLTDVLVSDALITPNSTTCASVAPGATCVLTGSYVVQASDVTAGQIVNTGTADSDQTAAVTDSETTAILTPSLSINKAAPTNADEDGNTEVSIGDTLSYSITATNDGAATLTDVVVSDALITPNSTTCASVAPGATCVLTGSYVVQASDVTVGQIVNTGTADSDQTAAVTDSETTAILTPSLSINKAAPTNADEDGNTEVSIGDTLSYSITATNDGAATLTDVLVSDALITPNSTTCASVAPGATCVLTGSYVVQASDVTAGQIVNTGTADSDQTDPVTDSETTSILASSLSVVKAAPTNADEDGNTEVSIGDTLSYSITATNDGAATLTDVVVSDALITPNSTTCASVAPGATCVLTGSYVVQASDVTAGQIVNTGTADSDQTAAVTDSETTAILTPSLSINKAAPTNADEDGNTEVSIGDTLSYSITATNSGAATLTDVLVSDALITPNSTTCASVAPGATCVLTGSYVVQASDVTAGQIVNTGTADSDQTAAVTDSETTSILASSLSVVKAAPTNADEDGNTEVSIGDTLSYSITATNDGAATLTDVLVSDALITPNSTTCASVAPGATCVLTGSYVVQASDVTAGQIVNTGTADSDQTAAVTDSETTAILTPSLSINKAAPTNADEDGNTEVSIGDTLSYSITATNDGAATLTDVVVSDALITPNSTTCASVAPGATCVLTGTYVVQASDVTAGQIVNTGTADSSQTDPVTDSETTETTISEIKAAKAASNPRLNADGSFDVDYTIVVKNTGTTSLSPLALNDDLGSQLGSALERIVAAPTVSILSNASGNSQLPTANGAYTGLSPAINLISGSDGRLDSGDSYQLRFTVRINPNATNAPVRYLNQATASGNAGSLSVSDISDSGSNPESNNPGAEGDSGGIDDPTALVPPTPKTELQSAKFPGTPVLNPDLTFTVPFTIIVKNSGNVTLRNLALLDDLSLPAQLGTAFVGIVSAPVASISNNISGTAVVPSINPGYSGNSANPGLLLGADGLLAPGDEYTVNFTAKINPEAAGAPTELKNQSTATAVSPSGSRISDLSDTGTVAESNNPGVEGDSGGSNDPTLLGSFVVPPADLLISKTVSNKIATAGDLISYTILIRNNSNYIARDVTITDNLPNGFKIDKTSIRVKTYAANHTLVTDTPAISSGLDPVNISALTIPIAAEGYLKISYIVRIGSNIIAVSNINTAEATANANSNTATATVSINQNTVLNQSSLIGKVFHDRDADGYQDDANATGISLKSDYFGWNSLHLGGLNGRVSVLDDPNKYRKVIRMPYSKKNDFKVTTQQGSVITVDNRGQISESHIGKKAKGLTAQDIRVTTRRIRGIPTQTPVKAMRIAANETDVLEITIINYGIHEEGIPGVRLATVEGLLIETDGHGRYHIPDVDGGRRGWGKNFILKVDPASLPEGARFTTENPRVLRITGQALNKINFGVRLPIQKAPERKVDKPAQYKNQIRKRIVSRKVPVYKTVKVELASIFFDKDKYSIRADQRGNLELLMDRIQQYGKGHIVIDAYTDARHTANYNIQLANKRANTIRHQLNKRLGASLMRQVKIEVDKSAYQEVPHNDPNAIDYKETNR